MLYVFFKNVFKFEFFRHISKQLLQNQNKIVSKFTPKDRKIQSFLYSGRLEELVEVLEMTWYHMCPSTITSFVGSLIYSNQLTENVQSLLYSGHLEE